MFHVKYIFFLYTYNNFIKNIIYVLISLHLFLIHYTIIHVRKQVNDTTALCRVFYVEKSVCMCKQKALPNFINYYHYMES